MQNGTSVEPVPLTGVEPRFKRLNDEDPESFIVSANVKRRNLTAPQRAVAAAHAWARAEASGRVQTHGGNRRSSSGNPNLIREPAKHFAALYGVSQDYAHMARAVLAYSEALAGEVRAGLEPLDAAYDQADHHFDGGMRAERGTANTLISAPAKAEVIPAARAKLATRRVRFIFPAVRLDPRWREANADSRCLLKP